MEIEPKRVPFSAEEKQAIENLVSKYKLDVVTDRRSDGAAPSHKKKAWMELTLEYNAVPDRRKRSVDQLKKCWDNMKTRKKKELILKKHTDENGIHSIKDEEVYSALNCVETLIEGEACGEPLEDSTSYQQIRYTNGHVDSTITTSRAAQPNVTNSALRVKIPGQVLSGSVTTNSSGFDDEPPPVSSSTFDSKYQSLLMAEQELKILIAREELRIKRLERVRLQEELDYVRACRNTHHANATARSTDSL